jgi:SecD/SecF fusion protein
MFDFWQSKGWLTKLSMMRLFAKPDFDFMSIRYVMFTLTIIISVLGLGLFIGRIPNDLNIDFVGGTAYGGKLSKAVDTRELRTMVDEEHQKKVLTNVTAELLPGTDNRGFMLTFPHGDKKPRTVSLNNVPDGKTDKKELEDVVAKRASRLPDASVELMFNSTDVKEIEAEMKAGRSRNFAIRTTEKEPELVQACLDQLLTQNGESLLKKVYAQISPLDRREVTLKFFYDPAMKETPATASPSFVKTLLNRELRRKFHLTQDKDLLPFVFEVNGEGNSDLDGKYSVMKVTFSAELKQSDEPKVKEALQDMQTEFAARPLPDRLENFDAALATETRYRALWAILASWASILMYLWFRFGSWTFGLAAVLCLIHDLFFTIGGVAVAYFIHGTFIGDWLLIEDFKFDLPSVAALLTLAGYSVSDTIVVFDRIREVRGKNPDLTPKMINDSINQTLSRTILSSLTVWLVVTVLYFAGGPGVHLFAYVMVIGVLVGTYSSIYIASPLLLIFGEGKHEEALPQGAKLPSPQPESAPA